MHTFCEKMTFVIINRLNSKACIQDEKKEKINVKIYLMWK